MFKKKKKSLEKISIQEFLKLKEAREKRLFNFQPYPWPVNFALLLPLSVFILLLLTYYFHVRGVAG
jgi:hypothetical protein